MKFLFKIVPIFLVLITITACDVNKFTEKFMGNIKTSDSKFWLKMVLTVALLLGLQYFMRRLRKK